MVLDRRELLVLLLNSPGPSGIENEPIVGVTRLQKFLYLLKREHNIDKISRNYFAFESYKFGPFASQLYDDIAFLENLDFIESGKTKLELPVAKGATVTLPPLMQFAEHSASEADVEEARAGYDYMIGSERNEPHEEDSQERVFRLTEKGKTAAHAILEQVPTEQRKALVAKLGDVKRHYGGMSLRQLLGYVYREYPESATESEIIDRV